VSKKDMTARQFALKQRKRRQWITFLRMVRYGINNFSRNTWLTVAATAVMTITLLIMFITYAASQVLADSVAAIKKNVDVSIYVKTNTSQSDINQAMASIRKLSTVSQVSYASPDAARQQTAVQNSTDAGTLQALNEAKNNFPGTIHVNLTNINNTGQLQNFVEHNTKLQGNLDPNYPPSYAGKKKTAIDNIGKWTTFAQKLGLIATIIFVAISSLIVFNTIRMAIFNRKDEIQMMKLIGADRSFIRGPFVVEAIVYGFIAAIVAACLGIGILYYSQPSLAGYGIAVGHTVSTMTAYIGFVLIAMILIGALIGIVSSLLATRRYLKI
jgi:cell division transport system permease protein